MATGGLPDRKNQLLMQIYADVTGREIKVTAASQTPALGSAMFGAVAAGGRAGGYDSIFDAAQKMARLKDEGLPAQSGQSGRSTISSTPSTSPCTITSGAARTT